jgi:energy-converting hydrogenase Eha subunit A
MKDTTYTTDIKAYIKYGNKQNSNGLLPTTHYEYVPAESQDLTTKISTRTAQFGRVAIVTALAIVSVPVAIASSIVVATVLPLCFLGCEMRKQIKTYIDTPKQQRNLTALLKETGNKILLSIVCFFKVFGVFSADITLLAITFLTHTKHMQILMQKISD